MVGANSSWLRQQAEVLVRDPVCLAVFGPPIPNPPIRISHPGSNTNIVAIYKWSCFTNTISGNLIV